MSNKTYICIPCRYVTKYGGSCPHCGETTKYMGNWSAPKKNNNRAWKRIEKGEYLWDRRRKRKRVQNDTFPVWDYEKIPVEHEDPECGHDCCKPIGYRIVRIPGSRRDRTNFRRTPDVDLGG